MNPKVIKNLIKGIFIVIFLLYINHKFCIIPYLALDKGEIENPRICSTYLPYNDNLIAFGGYNANGTDNEVRVHSIEKNQEEVIFKSNFNNSYGNFAAVFQNKKGEDILINIQPIQFNNNSKYGVETYNFKTKELKIVSLPIKKRTKNENFRYQIDEENIYILDDTNVAEIIGYGGEKPSYEKHISNYTNYGLFYEKEFGGIKNGELTDKVSGITGVDNYPVKLNLPVKNPQIYELKPSFWRDADIEAVVVDKTNIKKPIQAVFWYYPFVETLNLPLIARSGEIIDIIHSYSNNSLIFFIKKGKNIYLLEHSNWDSKLKLKQKGRIKTEYKNQKYINISDEIYQIGGIKTKGKFNCGDPVTEDMEIKGSILWL